MTTSAPRTPAGRWVGTWATAPTGVAAGTATVFEDVTLRQVVRTSAGGDAVRVRFSNEFGDEPLLVGEARVALLASPTTAGEGTRAIPGTDRALTFGGASSATAPAGAPLLSDPVELALPPGADLVVSLHLPRRTRATTVHGSPFQENQVVAGNATAATAATAPAGASVLREWCFLTGVSARTQHPGAAAVVALGDSITDGSETTWGANRRWPDLLAARLRQAGRSHLGVLNAGICGNRLLHDPNPPADHPDDTDAVRFGPAALRRFDRDVLAQPGVRHVVVLLGVNDLGHPGRWAPPSEAVRPEDVVAAHRQLLARAHQHGVRVYGATILPFAGHAFAADPGNEAARRHVNDWIRTSGEHDAVLDLDAAVRDPARPERLLPRYDCGDGLHPDDTGMQALADVVPLDLFD